MLLISKPDGIVANNRSRETGFGSLMGTSGDSGALHFYGSAVLVKVPGVAVPATIAKPLATSED
jgi:hypothetical protein